MNFSFKNYYWRWLKNQLILFFIFLSISFLARIAFMLFFGDFKTLLTEREALVAALWLGVRFDLIPLAYINVIPFVLFHLAYLVPGQKVVSLVRSLAIGILSAGYFLLLWLYVFDYGFYSYFQDHLNVLVFGFIEDDTRAVLMSIWKNYNLPLWGSLIIVLHFILYYFIKLLFSPFDFDLNVKKFDNRYPISLIMGLVVLAWFARGSFNRLPLSIEDAHISTNAFINKLPLNGTITLNRAIKIRKTFGNAYFDYLKMYGYSGWDSALKDADGRESRETLKQSLMGRTPVNSVLQKNPPHVVLVVMESFGSYWNDRNGENFNILGDLNQHFSTGIHFKNFLSAENGTIGSIVAVATSQVLRPGARYLSESEFMNTNISSSGHIPYKEAGYETHFVYGGKLGWRDLGKFLAIQGYDKLWGADEMSAEMPQIKNLPARDVGNEWGVFDEYLYSFIEEKLKVATRPQFFLVLTTSNHPPFEYPTTYHPHKIHMGKKLVDELTVDKDLGSKRFYGLQYANQKIAEFITRVKDSEVKDKTVIALTGDHSYWIAKGVGLDQEFKRYAVPFLINLPDKLRPKNVDTRRFGSHEDIFPTLYHLTLSGKEYVKLGDDLLGTEESFAINNSGLVANKDGAFFQGKYWKWKDLENQLLAPAEIPHDLIKLKKHYEGMISITDLFLKSEKAKSN